MLLCLLANELHVYHRRHRPCRADLSWGGHSRIGTGDVRAPAALTREIGLKFAKGQRFICFAAIGPANTSHGNSRFAILLPVSALGAGRLS